MATVNKKKKKKGEEAEEQVLQFKKFHYSSLSVKGSDREGGSYF